jgi:molybdopterin synthase catalytic subunit
MDRLTRDAVDVGALLSSVTSASIGAVASFVGVVRDHHDGRAVLGIDYEAYAPMAERQLRGLERDAELAYPGVRARVVHRIGFLSVGELSIAIVCAHARRAVALAATSWMIEEAKVRVPIWKREHYATGDWQWVDPTGRPRA